MAGRHHHARGMNTEHERMIALAQQAGWIDSQLSGIASEGIQTPVVLIISRNVWSELPFTLRFNRDPRQKSVLQTCRRVGVKPFAIGVADYLSVYALNVFDSWQDDMADLVAKGGTPVVCFSRAGVSFVALLQLPATSDCASVN